MGLYNFSAAPIPSTSGFFLPLNNPRMGKSMEVFGLFHVDLDKARCLAPVGTIGAPHGWEADFLSRRHYLLYINIPVLRISA